jgi:hypothetical protein
MGQLVVESADVDAPAGGQTVPKQRFRGLVIEPWNGAQEGMSSRPGSNRPGVAGKRIKDIYFGLWTGIFGLWTGIGLQFGTSLWRRQGQLLARQQSLGYYFDSN